MATFRNTRPGNFNDSTIWEVVPETQTTRKRESVMARLRRLIGWLWLPVPWLWRGCWDWDAALTAWYCGLHELCPSRFPIGRGGGVTVVKDKVTKELTK